MRVPPTWYTGTEAEWIAGEDEFVPLAAAADCFLRAGLSQRLAWRLAHAGFRTVADVALYPDVALRETRLRAVDIPLIRAVIPWAGDRAGPCSCCGGTGIRQD